MVTESDTIQAVEARLLKEKEKLLLRIRKIDDTVRSLRDARQWLGSGDVVLDDAREDNGDNNPRTKSYLADAIHRFMAESGKQEFSPAEVVSYLQGLGIKGKYLYNSTYEALRRMTEKGLLERAEGKFRVMAR